MPRTKDELLLEAAGNVVEEADKKQGDAGGTRRVDTTGGRCVSKGWDGIGTEQGVLSNAISAGKEFENSEAPASAADEPLEEAGEKGVPVGKAEDAMLEGTSKTIERLVSTAGPMAASVAMTGGFRCCSEFDIVKSRAACANPAICILR